jgi:hypothetical protein
MEKCKDCPTMIARDAGIHSLPSHPCIPCYVRELHAAIEREKVLMDGLVEYCKLCKVIVASRGRRKGNERVMGE